MLIELSRRVLVLGLLDVQAAFTPPFHLAIPQSRARRYDTKLAHFQVLATFRAPKPDSEAVDSPRVPAANRFKQLPKACDILSSAICLPPHHPETVPVGHPR